MDVVLDPFQGEALIKEADIGGPVGLKVWPGEKSKSTSLYADVQSRPGIKDINRTGNLTL
jgi:hypothetical protein